MIFITGGARSGKSSLAVRLAAEKGAPVRLVATARVEDLEMAERVEEHRRDRPQEWNVVEEPLDLAGALRAAEPGETVLIDCVTLWISNLMLSNDDPVIYDTVERVADEAVARSGETIVVSNEVGSGVVPPYELGRRFRDVQGRANQVFSMRSERAYLVVAGRALALDSFAD